MPSPPPQTSPIPRIGTHSPDSPVKISPQAPLSWPPQLWLDDSVDFFQPSWSPVNPRLSLRDEFPRSVGERRLRLVCKFSSSSTRKNLVPLLEGERKKKTKKKESVPEWPLTEELGKVVTFGAIQLVRIRVEVAGSGTGTSSIGCVPRKFSVLLSVSVSRGRARERGSETERKREQTRERGSMISVCLCFLLNNFKEKMLNDDKKCVFFLLAFLENGKTSARKSVVIFLLCHGKPLAITRWRQKKT